MKLPKLNLLDLATTYIFFGLVYGAIVTLCWNYLFELTFNIHLSFLQGFGIYLISRILFGNTNTNYISNFYNQKTPDLDKIDDYLKEMQEELDKEADEVEKQYQDLDKKD
ncbi:MAG: hypothetical protein EBR82_80020 [Caulobacteraceae bacterium]|nr:hypothetical protein [Caulobacteraceae bacterium]